MGLRVGELERACDWRGLLGGRGLGLRIGGLERVYDCRGLIDDKGNVGDGVVKVEVGGGEQVRVDGHGVGSLGGSGDGGACEEEGKQEEEALVGWRGHSRWGTDNGCGALGWGCPMLGSGCLEGEAHGAGILGDGGAGKVVVGGNPWFEEPCEGKAGAGSGDGKDVEQKGGKVEAEGQELGHGVWQEGGERQGWRWILKCSSSRNQGSTHCLQQQVAKPAEPPGGCHDVRAGQSAPTVIHSFLRSTPCSAASLHNVHGVQATYVHIPMFVTQNQKHPHKQHPNAECALPHTGTPRMEC